jgi:hypothetical protein
MACRSGWWIVNRDPWASGVDCWVTVLGEVKPHFGISHSQGPETVKGTQRSKATMNAAIIL